MPTDPTPPADDTDEAAHKAVYRVISEHPPRSTERYGIAVENARLWRAVQAALDVYRAERDRLAAQVAGLREQRVDPRMLRWCGWPGCLASYDAASGPSDHGWIRPTSPDTLLCPEHADRGHRPSYDWERATLGHVVGVCSCGISETVTPATLGGVSEWWSAHVAALDTLEADRG